MAETLSHHEQHHYPDNYLLRKRERTKTKPATVMSPTTVTVSNCALTSHDASFGWPYMCHSALLQYLSPCFFIVSLFGYPQKIVGCSVACHSSRIFCFANPVFASPIFLIPSFSVPNIKKACVGNFATLVRTCASWVVRATRCQRPKHERTNGNTDSKPWFWHVFSLFCLHSALAECI